MISTIRSEFTKFLTLPGTWTVTGILFALFLYIQNLSFGENMEMMANVRPDGMVGSSGKLVFAETEITQYLGTGILNASLILPILGVVIAGAEFRAGQLGQSLVAVPNRNRMILGKILATSIYVLGYGVLCVTIATGLTYLAIKNWNPALLWSPAMWAAHGRLLLFMVTFALIGLAITLITRRTLIGIIATVVLLMLTFAQVIASISPTADAFLPLSAARNLLLQGGDAGAPLTGSAEHGAMVLICWAVIGSVLASLVTNQKDAR